MSLDVFHLVLHLSSFALLHFLLDSTADFLVVVVTDEAHRLLSTMLHQLLFLLLLVLELILDELLLAQLNEV